MKTSDYKVPYSKTLITKNGIRVKWTSRRHNFPRHVHNGYFFIGFALSGTGTLHVQNNSYLVDSESLMLINPGVVHSFDGQGDNTICNILIPTEMFYKFTKKRDLKFLRPVIKSYRLSSTLKSRFYSFFWHLNETGVERQCQTFLEEMASVSESVFYMDTAGKNLNVHLQNALNLMHSVKTQSNISIHDIAKTVGYSFEHFSRLFNTKIGINPSQYRTYIRLEEAGRLIESGSPISEAAYECGFSDQAHLTRQFKKFLGLTPREWIKK
jgi:AraC-like DNA-binding protein